MAMQYSSPQRPGLQSGPASTAASQQLPATAVTIEALACQKGPHSKLLTLRGALTRSGRLRGLDSLGLPVMQCRWARVKGSPMVAPSRDLLCNIRFITPENIEREEGAAQASLFRLQWAGASWQWPCSTYSSSEMPAQRPRGRAAGEAAPAANSQHFQNGQQVSL